MKTLYIIREPGKKVRYNFSLCYNHTRILSSHGQGYSRRGDCIKTAHKNVLSFKKTVFITRAEFSKKFGK